VNGSVPHSFEEDVMGKKLWEYDCERCIYYRVIHERHPYGSTYATETLVDCVNEDIPEEFLDQLDYLPVKDCPYVHVADPPELDKLLRKEEDKLFEQLGED
jgi:hypothetical protein